METQKTKSFFQSLRDLINPPVPVSNSSSTTNLSDSSVNKKEKLNVDEIQKQEFEKNVATHIEYGDQMFINGYSKSLSKIGDFLDSLSNGDQKLFKAVSEGLLMKITHLYDYHALIKNISLLGALNKHKILDGKWYSPFIKAVDTNTGINKNIYNDALPAHCIFKYCNKFYLAASEPEQKECLRLLMECLDSIIETNYEDFMKHQAIILAEFNSENDKNLLELRNFVITQLDKKRLNNVVDESPEHVRAVKPGML